MKIVIHARHAELAEDFREIAEEKLADYIDAFCERNYFSVK